MNARALRRNRTRQQKRPRRVTLVDRATDAVPDGRMALPLVDEHGGRLRQREADIRSDDSELGQVVELVARFGALSRGRGLPDGPCALGQPRRRCRERAPSQTYATDSRLVALRILNLLGYESSDDARRRPPSHLIAS